MYVGVYIFTFIYVHIFFVHTPLEYKSILSRFFPMSL